MLSVASACGSGPVDAGVAGDAGLRFDAGSVGDVGDSGVSIGAWTPLAPLARGARQETAVVALGGEIFVIGGFDATPVIVRTVEAYSPATDSWRDIAELPVALHHANAAAALDKIFVLGSLGPAFVEDARCFVYDPLADAWDNCAPLPAARARGASAVATLDDGRIFVIGGFRAQRAVADVDAYDPRTDSWSEQAPLPRASDHVVAGGIAGKIYVAGGRSGGIAGLTDRVDVFDPATATWSLGPPMPTARAGSAAAVLGTRLYVFGGEGDREESTGVFDETESFDATAEQWTRLAPMSTPRHGTGAASLGDRIYVPGGADVQAFSAVAVFEAFVP